MYDTFTISKEQAKQFAQEIYEVLIQDIIGEEQGETTREDGEGA